MTHAVSFAPEAEQQLLALYTYIAEAKSADVAERYVSSIVVFCEGLGRFPRHGTARDDIRPGLRIIGFKRRVMIAFVADQDDQVTVIGVFYGGRDYESLLADG